MHKIILRLKQYFIGIKEEMRQVSWLGKDELVYSSVIVILLSTTVAVYLGLLDFVFSNFIIRFIIK